MAEVIWSDEAASNLADIIESLVPRNRVAASDIAHRLRTAADSLSVFPDRGRPAAYGRRELPSVPPYVISYRVDGDRVLILTIRHGRQQPR